MGAEADAGRHRPSAIIVPELRDYHQINAELIRRLQLGQSYVRLEGVEGQRLLCLELSGPWHATIDVDGAAGPELAAGMNAPNVTVVCRRSAADGAGRSLTAGRLVILGTSGTGLGYHQRGGLIVVRGDTGPRAGLGQLGGDLVLLGRCGPLAGERQRGGRLFLHPDRLGPHVGKGTHGGRLVFIDHFDRPGPDDDQADAACYRDAVELTSRFGHPA